MFTWVEWLKQQENLWAPAAEADPVAPPPVDSDAELAAALQQVSTAELTAHMAETVQFV